MPRPLATDALVSLLLAVVAFDCVADLHDVEADEATSGPVYPVKHETKVPVPMPDGVKLAAEIYRPDAPGRFPALMLLRYFRGGHRIRLDVSSSNFPRYARNQNTGLPLGTSALVKKAQQTVYHDARRPSCLILPVIPADGKR
ncbi:MAG: CocE/NonD family hydrolase C-terminal non-catalytic domain-containing protein [Planctomycetota bacterium]